MTQIVARNRLLYEQRAVRGEIRTIVMAHSQIERQLTANRSVGGAA
jgi:hypothetical protein